MVCLVGSTPKMHPEEEIAVRGQQFREVCEMEGGFRRLLDRLTCRHFLGIRYEQTELGFLDLYGEGNRLTVPL